MSPDLRALLHEAAPRPARGLDEREVERRARRIGVARVLTAFLGVAVVATGGAVAASLVGTLGDVRPGPGRPQHEIDVDAHPRPVPPGPRHVLTSGPIGDDWDEAWEGDRWELVAWGTPSIRCWQVRESGSEPNEGRGCTYGPGPTPAREVVFGATSTSYTGSRDPDEYLFIAGEVGPVIRRLVFRDDRGDDLEIPLHRPPASTGIAYRYFAVALPRFDYAHLEAANAGGTVLSSRRLCGVACLAQREAEEEVEVLTFEHTPVTLESAAAAFANEAAGHAGITDQLATYWSYRTISPEELVATFRTTECYAHVAQGDRLCDTSSGVGTIDVDVVDGRFVVETAVGTMSDEQRAALLSYSAPFTDDVREWRPIAESFARSGRRTWDVAFLAVWTGNLGAPDDYGSICRHTVLDASGRVVDRSPGIPFLVRDEERDRVLGFRSTVEGPRPPADLVLDCGAPRPGILQQR